MKAGLTADTGASKYVLIVARSTFQSHCRALSMCRDIFSFIDFLRFAQPLSYLGINMLDSDWVEGANTL